MVEIASASFNEEENFIFCIKKADILRIIRGNGNIKIKIKKEFVSKLLKRSIFKVNPIIDDTGEELTDREVDVLKSIVLGKTNKEIADELIVTDHTIKVHVSNIFQKLNVKDRVQAAVKAILERIIEM